MLLTNRYFGAIIKALAEANSIISGGGAMTLRAAEEGKEYIIKAIETDDEELNSFLFSLGCFSGESITVIKKRRSGCVVAIKDGRYNIDNELAKAIII